MRPQTHPSGLQLADLEVGSGPEAKAGKTIEVHYRGMLENGQEFDSSYRRGTSFSLPLGFGRVIPGWDEGIQGMKVGGKRLLVIPPHLAYGSRGAGGVIPPNATLTFEVELVAVDGIRNVSSSVHESNDGHDPLTQSSPSPLSSVSNQDTLKCEPITGLHEANETTPIQPFNEVMISSDSVTKFAPANFFSITKRQLLAEGSTLLAKESARQYTTFSMSGMSGSVIESIQDSVGVSIDGSGFVNEEETLTGLDDLIAASSNVLTKLVSSGWT